MENNWFLYASLAGLLIGINTVMNNYFMNKNINPYIMLILKALFFLFLKKVSLIITIIQSQNGNITLKECIELEMNDVGLMFLGGLFTTLIMFYSFMAVFQVPNTAYSTSIKGSVALTTGFILSLIFLQGQFNIKAILGMILVFCGGYLIKNNS